MPKFEAASVVEELRYDFNPYVDAAGVIDEPTDKMVGAFMSEIQELTSGGLGRVGISQEDIAEAGDDPEKIMNAVAGLKPDEVVKVMSDMAAAYAKLCDGKPSKAQLLKLPLRVRVLFFGWLQREVMSPEAVPPAGIAGVTPLPRAAGG